MSRCSAKLSEERRLLLTDYEAFYAGKTILVTGGAGAIGCNLCSTLIEHGASVIVLDDLSSGNAWALPPSANLLFVEGSILDEVKLKRVYFERPDIIFHLAAFFANQNSVDHPENDLMVNGMGTLRLLEYSALHGVERFVYASSGCAIYGGGMPLPLREDFITMDLSTPYQVTKMLGELYCNFFHHHYEVPVVKPRFFNSYGPGECPGQYRNVIPNFIFWALKGLELPITGTGEETRDFTYVGDLVDGLLRAGYFESALGLAFNLSGGREISIGRLAEMINSEVGNGAGIRFAKARKWDTKKRLLASIDLARQAIGYSPRTAFEDGLKATVQWFKANWERIQTSAEFGPGASSAVRDMAGG